MRIMSIRSNAPPYHMEIQDAAIVSFSMRMTRFDKGVSIEEARKKKAGPKARLIIQDRLV